ncbi:glycerophosphodiester phosphodiesterase family protein [Paracoccus homiensis]|uniref:glycerophosphodiester phosphodiesterase family protein n=1 Tax=Paracoccus homiensis TaxID=364199 RepID=UPI00398D42B6
MKFQMLGLDLALAVGTFAAPAFAASYNTLTGEKPLVVAHRGASGYLPEETLGSYELSMQMGADLIEPDLQLTRDGHLVAMHDSTLTRTTNVEDLFATRNGNYYVKDFTLAEIKSLTVQPTGALSRPDSTYPGFTPSMADPYKVPTFAEVLDLLSAYNDANGTRIGIYPESKAPHDAAKNALIVQTLKDKGFSDAEDRVILQTFSKESVADLADLIAGHDVSAEIAQLGAVRVQDGLFGVRGSDGFSSLSQIAAVATGVGVSASGITREFIAEAHALGLKVHAYTFRPLSQEEAIAMITPFLDWGLDGFFTDYTDFGRTAVDSHDLAPVPLPAGMPLLLAGLGGFAWLRRRKAAA